MEVFLVWLAGIGVILGIMLGIWVVVLGLGGIGKLWFMLNGENKDFETCIFTGVIIVMITTSLLVIPVVVGIGVLGK